MTLEEMQEMAAKIVDALKAAGFVDVQYDDSHEPGEPLPIMFTADDGESFALELSPL